MFTAAQAQSAAMARSTAVGNRFFLLQVITATVFISFLHLSCASEREKQQHQKEALLRQSLFVLREQIDNYTLNKKKAPQSLQDLITAGYLKEIPADPFTGSAKTWITLSEETFGSKGQTDSGITDVHSGSNAVGSDGTPYSSW